MMPRKKKAAEPPEFKHDVLFLRSADHGGRSYNGTFQWPLEAGGVVEAPDWDPERICGGGLHGLLDGLGDWGLLASPGDLRATWYVCGARADELVWIDEQKIKVPRCRVIYVGTFVGAMELIAPRLTDAILRRAQDRIDAATLEGPVAEKDGGLATASGSRGAATASGYSGAATASGDSGAATASGSRGAATASGPHSVALACGFEGRARVEGEGALLILVERDLGTGEILHHFAAKVGEHGVEPGVWYTLRDGQLVNLSEENDEGAAA